MDPAGQGGSCVARTAVEVKCSQKTLADLTATSPARRTRLSLRDINKNMATKRRAVFDPQRYSDVRVDGSSPLKSHPRQNGHPRAHELEGAMKRAADVPEGDRSKLGNPRMACPGQWKRGLRPAVP